jgi:hypothetical protein
MSREKLGSKAHLPARRRAPRGCWLPGLQCSMPHFSKIRKPGRQQQNAKVSLREPLDDARKLAARCSGSESWEPQTGSLPETADTTNAIPTDQQWLPLSEVSLVNGANTSSVLQCEIIPGARRSGRAGGKSHSHGIVKASTAHRRFCLTHRRFNKGKDLDRLAAHDQYDRIFCECTLFTRRYPARVFA